jgi:hypothetical protein
MNILILPILFFNLKMMMVSALDATQGGCPAGFYQTSQSNPVRDINFKVAITVDNSYGLFYGDKKGASEFIGADYDWTTTKVYTFKMPNYRYLYVVTESDLDLA